MYDRFYGFNEEPFRLSPDHHFAYQHRGYKKARAYMSYAFMRAEGFVMVTGRPGTGKTTLVGAIMEDLAGERAQIANLVCSQLHADDLLSMVAHEFGVGIDITNKGQQLQYLTRQLLKLDREGRRALLIVDEAQDLSLTAMEELRLLTNIQSNGRPLLQIFLLGQPELRELILRPEMEQVHQRIVAATHLKPLELDETEDYVRHRLDVAGWQGDPAISETAYPLIFKFSEGIARRINLICSRLLLHGSVEQIHRIGVQDVRAVVEELQEESLAAGSMFSDHDFKAEDVYEGVPDAKPGGEDSDLLPEQASTDEQQPGLQTGMWNQRQG
ncbi:MAG: AAA family ATPase [Pseudomonadota bacterium]